MEKILRSEKIEPFEKLLKTKGVSDWNECVNRNTNYRKGTVVSLTWSQRVDF